MPNPLDFVTQDDINSLGLLSSELINAYQPSTGGFYHSRGFEGAGKTLLNAHFLRFLVDSGRIKTKDIVTNTPFKGKYAVPPENVLKGEDLRAYLWDTLIVPYTDKTIFISEAESEFPARSFSDKDQTTIASRLWHVNKMGLFILMDSHIGNSCDLIMHLASHYVMLPDRPDWNTNTMSFTFVNNLENWYADDLIARNIIQTMLIYGRKDLTEPSGLTYAEHIAQKARARRKKNQAQNITSEPEPKIDLDDFESISQLPL